MSEKRWLLCYPLHGLSLVEFPKYTTVLPGNTKLGVDNRVNSAIIAVELRIVQGKKMPKVKRDTNKALDLRCEDSSDTFSVRYTNMGEPFREGINIGIENTEFEKGVVVMLEDYEAKQLRDLLLELYPLIA